MPDLRMGIEIGSIFDRLHDGRAVFALDQHAGRLALQSQHLLDLCRGADAVELGRGAETMNGAVSGTSVMVPQAHQGGATRTAGAPSLYSLVGLGAGTDSLAAF